MTLLVERGSSSNENIVLIRVLFQLMVPEGREAIGPIPFQEKLGLHFRRIIRLNVLRL